LGQRVGVAAVHGHDVHRVVPKLEGALRSRRTEVHAEGKHFPVPDQACGLGDLVRGDEVQRADLVVVSPASPVGDIASDLSEVGQTCHGAPSSSSPAIAAATLPPSTHTTSPDISLAERLFTYV